MSDLKTLKDMEYSNYEQSHNKTIYIDDLKQEAIKWIKHIDFRCSYNHVIELDHMNLTDEEIEETKMCSEEVICWIINFFNITKEDLKKNE